jgi:hypothetical protein
MGVGFSVAFTISYRRHMRHAACETLCLTQGHVAGEADVTTKSICLCQPEKVRVRL